MNTWHEAAVQLLLCFRGVFKARTLLRVGNQGDGCLCTSRVCIAVSTKIAARRSYRANLLHRLHSLQPVLAAAACV